MTIHNPVQDSSATLLTFLTVLASPAILTAPADLTVSQGQSAAFTVSASGDNLAYQWAFLGADIPGATGPTYTLQSAQPANQGLYSVTVSNAVGTAKAQAALTILPLNLGLSSPILQGGSFSFSFLSQSNRTYIIQFKDRLTDADWLSLSTNNGTGGIITTYLPATNASGFYRVLAQ